MACNGQGINILKVSDFTNIYVLLYLVAIISATVMINIFGPAISILNAFLFIGFDIVARDKLHEKWHNNNLVLHMGVLILLGSVLSFAINPFVAIASFTAFLLANIVDTIVYQMLYSKKFITKSNTSNVFSALTDSIVFPVIAFGGFPVLIILGQFIAKVAGGFIWSLIISRYSLTVKAQHS